MQYLTALAITIMAGMATLLGGCFTFFVNKNDLRVLAIGLGFSAGVMIYISFSEVLIESKEILSEYFSGKLPDILAFISFFTGILIAIMIDYFVPDHIQTNSLKRHKKLSSQEYRDNEFICETEDCKNLRKKIKIKRAGVITAIAVALHNFPEGLATFMISSENLKLGIPIAIAIAIHNIPEGIAVALPVYQATGRRRFAILYTFLSGIAEPVGGVLGMFLLKTIMPEGSVGYMFAIVAGIMVYISFDTLLPLAREYGENHHVIIGIMSGIFVISLSLLLL